MMQLPDMVEQLTEQFNNTVVCTIAQKELMLEVLAANLPTICTQLKSAPYYFEQLTDLAGIDYSEYLAYEKALIEPPRFAVVYHLLSLRNNIRVRIKCYCENIKHVPTMPSIVNIWASANWYEREAYDLLGIIFTRHPELTRILMDEDFIGHPLRKDFPLVGNSEVYYDEKLQQIVQKPVTIKDRCIVAKVVLPANKQARVDQEN